VPSFNFFGADIPGKLVSSATSPLNAVGIVTPQYVVGAE